MKNSKIYYFYALLLSGCGIKSEVYKTKDPNIFVESIPSILPHASSRRILHLNGRSYPHLHSAGVVYIKQLNAWIFQTRRNPTKSCCIYVVFATGREVKIETPISMDGLGRIPGSVNPWWVGRVTGNVVYILEPFRESMVEGRTYALDLENKTLIEIKK
jgi:hypothetical protein